MLIVLALLIAAVPVAAVAATAAKRIRRRWLNELTATRVVVVDVDDRSIEGSLLRVDRDGLVLSAARLLDDGVSMAGDVFIPRERIRFVQTTP